MERSCSEMRAITSFRFALTCAFALMPAAHVLNAPQLVFRTEDQLNTSRLVMQQSGKLELRDADMALGDTLVGDSLRELAEYSQVLTQRQAALEADFAAHNRSVESGTGTQITMLYLQLAL